MLLCVRQANGMTDTPTLQELLNEQETLTMITTSNDDTFTQ